MRSRRAVRVDIVDETFVDAPPAAIAALVADPANHRRWWPGLRLVVEKDRGVQGIQWIAGGDLVGTMEIWIEPFWSGAIVHHYVRALACSGTPRSIAASHVRRWKSTVTDLKDTLEHRAGGARPIPPGASLCAWHPPSPRSASTPIPGQSSTSSPTSRATRNGPAASPQ